MSVARKSPQKKRAEEKLKGMRRVLSHSVEQSYDNSAGENAVKPEHVGYMCYLTSLWRVGIERLWPSGSDRPLAGIVSRVEGDKVWVLQTSDVPVV